MRNRIVAGLGIVLVACALQASAQGFRTDCNPAGTWYGGSAPFKYLLTIIPTEGNRYTVMYDSTYSLAASAFGFAVSTRYTGELIRKADHLELNAMAIHSTSGTAPVNPSTLHIWAIKQTGGFTDCDTLQMTDDLAAGYLWTSNKVPLKDAADYVILSSPLVETYHRLPSPQAAINALGLLDVG